MATKTCAADKWAVHIVLECFLVVQNVSQNKLSTQAIMCQRVCKIMTLSGVVLNITTNNLRSVGIEKVPSQCDYTANRTITMTFNYTSYVSPPTNVVVANNCLPVLLQTTIVHRIKQECIPVGCVPSAAVCWGEGCLPQCMLGYTPLPGSGPPPGLGPETPQPEPSTFPLGMGLETSPRPDPSTSPQVWTWRPPCGQNDRQV